MELGISDAEAKNFIASFAKQFPRVMEWIREMKHSVLSKNYVESIAGRRRYLQFSDSVVSDLKAALVLQERKNKANQAARVLLSMAAPGGPGMNVGNDNVSVESVANADANGTTTSATNRALRSTTLRIDS